MPSWQSAVRRFFSDQRGNVRIADNQLFAVGRNTVNQACTAQEEGTKRWTRGGTGAASYEEICLKSASDTYAWTTGTSGGSPGLAAHILDTTTHCTTGDIVGTTDTQTLTNKTLTSPTITTPNGLVKGDVGLGNVDNTSDATKNSAAVTLTNKTLTSPVINSPTITSPSGLVKADVGLGNVDNTSDATKNAAAVTLTNKTLTTPTIGDFSNATHAHTSAASGGTLSASAITSGTIGTARLGAGVADSSVFLRGDQTWSELPLVPGVWPAGFVDEFGINGTGNGEFSDGIRGIGIRSDTGDVYVSSGTGASSKIQKFSANGTFDSVIATYGTGNGEVDTPWGLVYLNFGGGQLYVVDAGNARVQAFDPSGDWSSTGSADYTGDGARGITYEMGLWGTLTDSDQIVFNVPTDSSRLGSTGTAPLEFDTPAGIVGWRGAPGSPVQLWIVDAGNHRIQAITITSLIPLTATVRYIFGSFGSGKGQFNTPDSIALDALGNIYVTDSGNHRVQVFDSVGIFQGTFGSFGTGDGEFNTPTGIAITDDYIYVCDSGNHRVQIFANPVGARSIIIADESFTVIDADDTTKQVQFDVSGVTTSTTRTLTVPDASGGLPVVIGSASRTWDPGNLGPGAAEAASPDFTITGAVVGDDVRVTHTAAGGLASALFTGVVSSVNTVQVALRNIHPSGSINVPSGTVKVTVLRYP